MQQRWKDGTQSLEVNLKFAQKIKERESLFTMSGYQGRVVVYDHTKIQRDLENPKNLQLVRENYNIWDNDNNIHDNCIRT